jgi:hypothetical protein
MSAQMQDAAAMRMRPENLANDPARLARLTEGVTDWTDKERVYRVHPAYQMYMSLKWRDWWTGSFGPWVTEEVKAYNLRTRANGKWKPFKDQDDIDRLFDEIRAVASVFERFVQTAGTLTIEPRDALSFLSAEQFLHEISGEPRQVQLWTTGLNDSRLRGSHLQRMLKTCRALLENESKYNADTGEFEFPAFDAPK